MGGSAARGAVLAFFRIDNDIFGSALNSEVIPVMPMTDQVLSFGLNPFVIASITAWPYSPKGCDAFFVCPFDRRRVHVQDGAWPLLNSLNTQWGFNEFDSCAPGVRWEAHIAVQTSP